MLNTNTPREFVQIRDKLKIRFICSFSWVHLLEVRCILCFLWESAVVLDILQYDANSVLLYLSIIIFFGGASQGCDIVYYIIYPNSPFV